MAIGKHILIRYDELYSSGYLDWFDCPIMITYVKKLFHTNIIYNATFSLISSSFLATKQSPRS